MLLEDKTAIITGGGSGIGLGIAQALSAQGMQLILVGRRQAQLQDAKASLARPDQAHTFAADVSQRDEVEKLIEFAKQQWSRFDLLVNAAGVNIPNRTMKEMRPEQWDDVLRINATGAYNCMYGVLPMMREQQDGLVINVCSISGKRALTLGGVAYCASKFAMAALGTAVGNEETANGIRVTTIYPGEVNTPILEQRPVPVPDEKKAIMVQPEDIGAMAVAIALLPQHTHVPELIIKPTYQEYV